MSPFETPLPAYDAKQVKSHYGVHPPGGKDALDRDVHALVKQYPAQWRDAQDFVTIAIRDAVERARKGAPPNAQ